jgi:hypothetical protein
MSPLGDFDLVARIEGQGGELLLTYPSKGEVAAQQTWSGPGGGGPTNVRLQCSVGYGGDGDDFWVPHATDPVRRSGRSAERACGMRAQHQRSVCEAEERAY